MFIKKRKITKEIQMFLVVFKIQSSFKNGRDSLFIHTQTQFFNNSHFKKKMLFIYFSKEEIFF